MSPRLGGRRSTAFGLLATLLAALSHPLRADTWPVTSTSDAGPGSLRAALEQANAHPGDDQIEIPLEGEIRLGAELPPVSGNTLVVGPGADRLRVVGSGSHRLISFLPGTTNRLSGLTLSGGRLTNGAPGAGLRNEGTLELVDCALTDHRNDLGFGGALHNLGDLLLLRCRVISNTVTGGAGGPGGFGGDGGGGGGLGAGVFSLGGRVVISNSVFEGNRATGGTGGRADGNNPFLAGSGGGPEGGKGGSANVNGGKGGLGSGGGGGGHSTGRGGNGGLGGGGGGGGANLPPMPEPGNSEFGGGKGGYASLAAGSGNGGGGGGGGGLGAAVFVIDSHFRAVNSRWEDNHAVGGQGGGAYSGGQGGGAYGAALFAQGGTVELWGCLLGRNTAEGGSGGGGHHAAPGGPAGGAAVFLRQAQASLVGCTLVSNLARAGATRSASRSAQGGIGSWGGGLGLFGGVAHLTNCTLSANSIQGGMGGTVYVGEDGGSAWGGGLGAISNAVTLVHCTITLNTALGGAAGFSFPGNPRGSPGEALGGGFHQTNGTVRLRNTIVASNRITERLNPSDGFGSIDSLGPNLFSTAAGLHGSGPLDLVGLDPRLGPLADHGGPTPVHPLLPGSPALDFGTAQDAPGTDQRGQVRPGGAAVDLGAYEGIPAGTPRAWILVDGQPVPGGSVRAVGTAEIALDSSLPGGQLHLTLDGTEPTPDSPRYDGPFAVVATSTIRATAFPPEGGAPVPAPTVDVVVIPAGSYRLTLATTGQGRLVVEPPEGPYPAGTRVRITALPDPFWAFAGWTGDADEPFRHTELVMASDRTLQALFAPFPSYPLNLLLEGLGRVELEPPATSYLSNAVVRLIAREVQNRDTTGYSAFTGWSGDLGGTSPTNLIVMNGPRTVTAHFPRTEWNPPRYWVHVTTPGGGSVDVDPAPAPGAYPSNSLVTLRAVIVEPRWEFMHWMGDVEGTNPVHTFRIRQNIRAIAVYATRPTYTALKTDPVGHPLETLPTLPHILNPEHTMFPWGATIRLTAVPPPGTMMSGWLGSYDGGWENPHVRFEAYNLAPLLGAMFPPLPTNRVAFTATARGRGRVSSTVNSGNHPAGGSATLTARPDPGQAFIGWTGDAAGTDPVLTVPLDVSRTIIGTFTERPTLSWVDVYGDGLPDRVRLQIDAAPGSRWILEGSDDLQTWRPVRTNSAPSGKHVLGIRPDPSGTLRSYRAVEAPR